MKFTKIFLFILLAFFITNFSFVSASTVTGSVTVTVTVTVPPVVTNPTVTNITSTSATVGATLVSSGTPGVIVVRGTGVYTTATPGVCTDAVGTGTGTYTMSKTGLTPDTTYYVYGCAKNSMQEIVYSATNTSFKTLIPGVTNPTVTTQTPSAVTQTGATLGGNVTSAGTSLVTARGVIWRTTAIDNPPTGAVTNVPNGSGTGIFTSSVSALTAGTPYHVRAYATSSAGTSYGEDLTFTTIAEITIPLTDILISGTPVVGQTLTATGLAPSGATATYQWQVNSADQATDYANISGAINSTYSIVDSNNGKNIRVLVTGTGSYSGLEGSAPTAKITKQLTIPAPTLTTSKVYDGSTSAAVIPGLLVGVISGDTVTVSAVANYDNANVGTGKTLTVVYTIAGASASKYKKPVNYTVSTGAITANPVLTVATGSPVTSITQTDATSSVTTGGVLANRAGIVWSTSQNPTVASNLGINTAGNASGFKSLDMTSLTANTIYHVRAYGSIDAGVTYTYGSDVSFTTLPPVAVLTVATGPATNITQTGASASVTTGGVSATQAGIVWSTTPNPTVASNIGINTAGWASGTSPALSMTSLTANNTYHVRAYGSSDNGVTYTYGSDVTFTTSACPCRITFDVNGVGASVTPAFIEVSYGDTINPLPTPVRANYKFNYWFTKTGTGQVEGTFYNTTPVTSSRTVYANWSIIQYTTTFDKNNSDQFFTDADPKTVVTNINATQVILPTQPTRITYTFASWNTRSDGNGSVFDSTTIPTSSSTVWAQWVAYVPGTPIISTKEITLLTETSASSGGVITSDGITPNGTATKERGIVWGTSQNPTTNNNKVIFNMDNLDPTTNLDFTSNITGLIANTTYYVRAYVINQSNTIGYGNQVSFKTLSTSVLTVATGQATSITQTGASASVTTGGVDATGGDVGIVWSATQNPVVGTNQLGINTGGLGQGAVSLSMTNLIANTTYYVKAYGRTKAVKDIGGAYTYGDQVSFTTSNNSVEPNTDPITVNLTPDTATIDEGDPIKLDWTSTNADHCNSSFFVNNVNGSTTQYPSVDTNYKITCVKSDGSGGVSDTSIIHVNPQTCANGDTNPTACDNGEGCKNGQQDPGEDGVDCGGRCVEIWGPTYACPVVPKPKPIIKEI